MSNFDGDPAEAEADLRRVADALWRAEEQATSALARMEEIEEEPFDGSPEAEADISRRHAAAERKYDALREAQAEAEDDLDRVHAYWRELGYLPS